MTYGAEVKNQSGKTIFGTKHLPLKKVKRGYTRVRVYNSNNKTTENKTSTIYLGTTANKTNALVFARPVLNENYGDPEIQRLRGFWPMAVHWDNNNEFAIVGPDAAMDYYDGDRGDKVFNLRNSLDMYGSHRSRAATALSRDLGDNQPICTVYYEVWIPGDENESNLTHGLQVKTASGADTVFNSNSSFFAVESTGLYAPRIAIELTPHPQHPSGDIVRYEVNENNSSKLVLSMKENIGAQSQYLALLSGGAHCCAFVKSGPEYISNLYYTWEVPPSIDGQPYGAYYKSFVEWHYSGSQNVEGGDRVSSSVVSDGAVIAKPRLAYTKQLLPTQEYQYTHKTMNRKDAILTTGNQLGPNPVVIIGKSS